MNTFSRILTKNRILWLTHIGSLLPFALLLWDYYADNLSVNPIQEITFRTGKPALVLLVLSLAVTPLNTIFGWREIIPARKWLGLYAWGYVSVHFLVFIGLDYGFDWGLLYEAIFEKRYALVGFAALLILTPLALTSTKGWQKRLGKKWKRLHQLVYAAGLLGVFHYLWLVKSDVREPIAWGVVVVLLLVARIPRVRKALVGWRTQLTGKNAPPSTSRSQRRVDPRQITSG
jgi:methionine sulfoxide reductase heme-binding subunit